MRASATSKAASPASYYSPQAKPDAHKADDTSPFALLVDSVAPKDPAKDAGQTPNKTPMKDASGDHAQDKDSPSDDQAATVQVSQSAPPAQPAKPGKTDKNKDDAAAKAGADTANPGQDVAAALPQLPQQIVPVQPAPQVVAAVPPAPTVDDDADDLDVDAATPAAPVKPQAGAQPTIPLPTLGQDIANGQASDATGAAKPASQAQSSSQTGNRPKVQQPATAQPKLAAAQPAAVPQPAPQSDDSDEGSQPVAPPADATQQISTAPASGTPAPAIASAQVAAGVANDDPDTSDTQAPDASKSHASATGVEHAAPRSAAARAVLPNPGQGDGAKNEPVKNGLAKIRAGQADAQTGTKTTGTTEKSDAPQTDAAKTAAAQPDSTPAPAPKSATPPESPVIAAVDGIAAPQAPAVQAPTVTQHVQVTAHAAPDLPALAVEIAAKSQSGAKQFDIRLDPPELGRVEVRLSIDATGKASAHLSADQPQTLSLLQKDATVLTRALRDAGLDVSQNGLNFSLRQQQGDNAGNAGSNNRRGSSRNFALSASLTIDATAGSAAYRGPANGRLDIRV